MPLISDMDRDADELQALVSGTSITLSDVENAMNSNLGVLLENPATQLAACGKPKNPERELALLAFGFPGNNDAIVVWCNDGHVRWEIGEQGPHEVATYILDNDAPDHGIWVWEGRIRWVGGGGYEYPEPPEPEYVTICWRAPTAEEWEAIQEQRNPFEPKPREDIDWNWGRKTSM